MSRYFNGKLHLNLRVRDMQRSLDFYVNKLGFLPMFRLKDSKGRKLEYLQIGAGAHLELYDCSGETVDQFPGQQSLTHFALYVDDFEGTVAQLRKNGVDFYLDTYSGKPYTEESEPIHGTCFCEIVWMLDPDGNRIELMGLTPRSLQKEHDPDW